MRKKTNKAVYIVLGILILLSVALAVFAIIKRRADFINEGNFVMAEFSVTFGLFFLGAALLSTVAVILLLKRDKRTRQLQDSFFAELDKSPAFKTWFLQEVVQIKNLGRVPRCIAVVFSGLIAIVIGLMIILVLDGINGVLMSCVILIAAAAIVFLLRFTDYNLIFIEPLLKSVELKLSAPASKEAFAAQIMGKQKLEFIYAKTPQAFSSTAFIMPDYCYFRQFGSSCVILNAQMCRIILKEESYWTGLRSHFRTCCVMELYLDSDSLKKPTWKGYFMKRESMYQALSLMQRTGLPEERIEDQIKKK